MLSIQKQVISRKFIPVVRGDSYEEAMKIIQACMNANISIIEMTYTNPKASEIIEALKDDSDIIIGAGSILNLGIATKAISAGAKFIVSPNLDLEVLHYAQKKNILYIPGCFTPTEIATASNHGVDFVKLFPGNALTMDYLQAVRGPLPHMKFMVTGGVDIDNIAEWLAAGANCVGLGSSLTKNIDMIKEVADMIMEKIK